MASELPTTSRTRSFPAPVIPLVVEKALIEPQYLAVPIILPCVFNGVDGPKTPNQRNDDEEEHQC